MITKGAVVMLKRGDLPMAAEMSKALTIDLIPQTEVAELQRNYDLLKKRDRQYWARKISRAQRKYSTKTIQYPNFLKPFVDLYALTLYGIATLTDKVVRCLKKK